MPDRAIVCVRECRVLSITIGFEPLGLHTDDCRTGLNPRIKPWMLAARPWESRAILNLNQDCGPIQKLQHRKHGQKLWSGHESAEGIDSERGGTFRA